MAAKREYHKTSYPGIRYRLHPTRKHGVGPDKYFSIFYKLNGKRLDEGVGWASGGWTLQKVAAELAKLKEAHRTGDGPQTLKEKRKAEQQRREEEEQRGIAEAATGSVKELFEAYVQGMKDNGKKTWRDVERALLDSKHAAVNDLGADTQAKTVTARDIQRILAKTRKRGISMAAHLRAYLHGAFAYGIGSEFDYTRPKQGISFDLQANPVASIPRDKTAFKAGERALTGEEVRQIWKELPEYCEEQTWQALRLVLATGGQRVQEVLHAPFEEFDLEHRLWILPAERAKNHREHDIPLSDRAVAIVARMKELAPAGCKWLFPHKQDSLRSMPSTSLNRAVKRYCDDVDMRPWTPRDLRRTCRTLLASEGVPSHVLNWHFNHGVQGVGEKHYDRSQHMNEKIEVMDRWETMLAKIVGDVERKAKVVHLHGKN